MAVDERDGHEGAESAPDEESAAASDNLRRVPDGNPRLTQQDLVSAGRATSNVLDVLLGRIDDAELQAWLASEVERLRDTKEFGLVFEKHIPETARLLSYPLRRGTKVQSRKSDSSETWVVNRIDSGQVSLISGDGEEVTRAADELVPVREFGDPIYPGLRSVGAIARGGDKPFHAVINAENYHALETLLFVYEGQVDLIYADPPYNTGARDWKYNNDYVDKDDRYRHSKWLSMMDKRLRLAKHLLNPESSVLIVTIDEKEYLRLGMLLEQIFKGARIQMVSSLVNPALQSRPGAFGRSDEYIFFVMQGDAAPKRKLLSRDWVSAKGRTFTGTARWDLLRRSGTGASRSDSPGGFYPIYVDPDGPKFHEVGEPLADGVSEPPEIPGAVAVLPIRRNRSEGRWQLSPETFRQYMSQGRVKIGGSQEKGYVIYYLKAGEYDKVLNGEYPVSGRNADGSLIIGEVEGDDGQVVAVPSTQWRIPSHDATQYGSRLLQKFLPEADFPFPKSLYAVRDVMSFFLSDKPDALIIDFFAGSGTTLHAGMLLNAQDDGRRRVILVTNNDVGDTTASRLNEQKHHLGDKEFERHGIFQSVTKPRIEAAACGARPDGTLVKGDYLDGRPMSDGFEENVEFFDLTYLDRNDVARGSAFDEIARLLWLAAGATGDFVSATGQPYAAPEGAHYAVLFDIAAWRDFVDLVDARTDMTQVFVVTDSLAQFQQVVAELPPGVNVSMLWDDYLGHFDASFGEG